MSDRMERVDPAHRRGLSRILSVAVIDVPALTAVLADALMVARGRHPGFALHGLANVRDLP